MPPSYVYVYYICEAVLLLFPNARRLHVATCNVYAINVFTLYTTTFVSSWPRFIHLQHFIHLLLFTRYIVQQCNGYVSGYKTLSTHQSYFLQLFLLGYYMSLIIHCLNVCCCFIIVYTLLNMTFTTTFPLTTYKHLTSEEKWRILWIKAKENSNQMIILAKYIHASF